MKEFDEVTERLATELNFLQEEGKASIVIAEAALNAAANPTESKFYYYLLKY